MTNLTSWKPLIQYWTSCWANFISIALWTEAMGLHSLFSSYSGWEMLLSAGHSQGRGLVALHVVIASFFFLNTASFLCFYHGCLGPLTSLHIACSHYYKLTNVETWDQKKFILKTLARLFDEIPAVLLSLKTKSKRKFKRYWITESAGVSFVYVECRRSYWNYLNLIFFFRTCFLCL